MRALLLNSGLGTRLEELTQNTCKCLVEIVDGMTILDRQIQSLFTCGIHDICITTGAFADQLEHHVITKYPQGNFTFINNPIYDKTNYIYSIYLAQEHLQQDILLLHGDLIFDMSVLEDLISANTSVVVIDSTKPLPEKDFKANLKDGLVNQIGINLLSGAYYTQPMYKLLKKDWMIWLDEINRFCNENNTSVYAEDAFNQVSTYMRLYPMDISGRFCFEVDNKADLEQARITHYMYHDYDVVSQKIYCGYGSHNCIKEVLAGTGAKKPMVICADRYFQKITAPDAVFFNEYTANPKYEDVLRGMALFEKENCDFLISIGGGSAMDIAKAINIMEGDSALTLRPLQRCHHLAVPTTAGTGSEATRFSVLYRNGKKFSIAHPNLLPEYVILDPSFLETLPIYHKKSAMLDALCQSIESLWAKSATPQSRKYAKESIRLVEENMENYLRGKDRESAAKMLQASYLSGKAINISRTTAAHAMSYELTRRFGLSHGHAVAICLPLVWEHLLEQNMAPEILSREKYDDFVTRLTELDIFQDFYCEYELGMELITTAKELADAVNVERLSNHPVALLEEEITDMYIRLGKLLNQNEV